MSAKISEADCIAVLEYLTVAACNAKPCPTNKKLSRLCKKNKSCSVLYCLGRRGLIKIENVAGNSRRIFVASVNMWTAPTVVEGRTQNPGGKSHDALPCSHDWPCSYASQNLRMRGDAHA